MASPETIIRTYLSALRDPSSLKDDEAVAGKQQELDATEDSISRLRLHQELRMLSAPSLDAVEDDFVVHGKAWAEEQGISAEAFAAEGVPSSVLRRAGFSVARGKEGSGRKPVTRRRTSGTRVTTDEVIAAMPKAAFTVKVLREISGASPAVVRKAITAEVQAGRLVDGGTDPDHTGPGRSPTLYRKK